MLWSNKKKVMWSLEQYIDEYIYRCTQSAVHIYICSFLYMLFQYISRATYIQTYMALQYLHQFLTFKLISFVLLLFFYAHSPPVSAAYSPPECPYPCLPPPASTVTYQSPPPPPPQVVYSYSYSPPPPEAGDNGYYYYYPPPSSPSTSGYVPPPPTFYTYIAAPPPPNPILPWYPFYYKFPPPPLPSAMAPSRINVHGAFFVALPTVLAVAFLLW